MKTDSLGVRMPNMLSKWQCTLHKINSLPHVIPRHWPRGRQRCVLPSILTHRALEEPHGVPVRKMHSSFKVPSSRSYPSASDCPQPSLTSVTAARGRIPWTRPRETRQEIETGESRRHTGILHHFKAGMQIQLWRKIVLFCIPGVLHSHAPHCPGVAGTIEHLSARLPGSTGWHDERTH